MQPAAAKFTQQVALQDASSSGSDSDSDSSASEPERREAARPSEEEQAKAALERVELVQKLEQELCRTQEARPPAASPPARPTGEAKPTSGPPPRHLGLQPQAHGAPREELLPHLDASARPSKSLLRRTDPTVRRHHSRASRPRKCVAFNIDTVTNQPRRTVSFTCAHKSARG